MGKYKPKLKLIFYFLFFDRFIFVSMWVWMVYSWCIYRYHHTDIVNNFSIFGKRNNICIFFLGIHLNVDVFSDAIQAIIWNKNLDLTVIFSNGNNDGMTIIMQSPIDHILQSQRYGSHEPIFKVQQKRGCSQFECDSTFCCSCGVFSLCCCCGYGVCVCVCVRACMHCVHACMRACVCVCMFCLVIEWKTVFLTEC